MTDLAQVKLTAETLRWLGASLLAKVPIAQARAPEVSWTVIPQARIQIGISYDTEREPYWRLFLRRPGGRVDPKEGLAVARYLRLEPVEEGLRDGRIKRSRRLGPRVYLRVSARYTEIERG